MPTLQETLFNGLRQTGGLPEIDITASNRKSVVRADELFAQAGQPPKPQKAQAAPTQALPEVSREQLLANADVFERLNPNAITPEGVPTLTDMKAHKKGLGGLITALETPQVQDLLVALGNTFLRSDGSDPISQFTAGLTQSRRENEVLNALRQGRPEDQRLTLGLDPRRRQLAQEQFNTEREAARRERETAVNEAGLDLRQQQILGELGIQADRVSVSRTQNELRAQELEFAKERDVANKVVDEELQKAKLQQVLASTALDKARAGLLGAQTAEEKDAKKLDHVRLAISYTNGLRGSIEANNERIDALQLRIDRDALFLDDSEKEAFKANHPLQATISKLEEANAQLSQNAQVIQTETFDDLLKAGFGANEIEALGISRPTESASGLGTKENPVRVSTEAEALTAANAGKYVSVNGGPARRIIPE